VVEGGPVATSVSGTIAVGVGPQGVALDQRRAVSAGLVVADFNGDGKPDILSTFQGDPYNRPSVPVLLNETVPYGAQTCTKRKSNVTGRK